MNAVRIHQFSPVEPVNQILIIVSIAIVWLLNATSGRCIITGNREANHRTVGQIYRTLHQSFTKRTASYNNPSVPILHGTADNLTGRSRIFIYQHHQPSILKGTVSLGIEIAPFCSTPFRVYNQFFLAQKLIGQIDSRIQIATAIAL